MEKTTRKKRVKATNVINTELISADAIVAQKVETSEASQKDVRISELEKQVKEKSEELESVSKSLAQYEKANKLLVKQAEESKKQEITTKEQMKGNNSTIASLKSELLEKVEEFKQLSLVVQDEKAKFDISQKEVKRWKDECKIKNKTIETTANENVRLKATIEHNQTVIKNLNSEIESLNTETDKLSKKNLDLSGSNAVLENKLSDKAREITALENEAVRLRSVIDTDSNMHNKVIEKVYNRGFWARVWNKKV